MLAMIKQWYYRRFSDPQAVALLVILLVGFIILYFFNKILAPLLVALVLAYLLEWPTVALQKLGCSRTLSVAIVLIIFAGLGLITILVIAPAVWQQGMNLTSEMPAMLNKLYTYAQTLPKRYPTLLDAGIIDSMIENMRNRLLNMSDSVVKFSLASLIGLVTLAIYVILVPMMIFFLLKDKQRLLQACRRFLPRNDGLAKKVWSEMNQQIVNYIRGKVIEMLVVGVATYITFFIFNLNYALLLAVLVGLSVLIPYIGAFVVTIPVVGVALFQWGISGDFWTVMIAYLVVQGLDANLLVPILFSEAVNLHPLAILLAVMIFGGLWGLWGAFFAIPLATLIKAIMHVWPDSEQSDPISTV